MTSGIGNRRSGGKRRESSGFIFIFQAPRVVQHDFVQPCCKILLQLALWIKCLHATPLMKLQLQWQYVITILLKRTSQHVSIAYRRHGVKSWRSPSRSHTHTHTGAHAQALRNWEHFSNIWKSPIIATSTAVPPAVVAILFSALSSPISSSSTLFYSLLRQPPYLSLFISTNLRASGGGTERERQNCVKSHSKIEFCFTERWSRSNQSKSTTGYVVKTVNSKKIQFFNVILKYCAY